MRLADWVKKNKDDKLRKEINLCLKAYEQGNMKGVETRITKIYAKNPADAIGGLSFIASRINIKNDQDLGRAKELRRLWKKLDPSSYKKVGLVLKNKCKDFLSKNVNKQAELCLSFFNQNKMDVLFKNLKTIYELEPNVCRHILKYIAQNTRCDDNSRVGVTKEYMDFWSKLDPSHYNKYQAKLKQAYVAAISQLSKSSAQKFLTVCQSAITKPQYAACEQSVQNKISAITSRLGSMYDYNYYNLTFLNKNDLLVVFLSSFMEAYIVPMGQILISLFEASGEGDKGPAKKCYNSLISNLRTNFNLTFKQDSGLDDIISQSESVCLKSSLEDIVSKLNNVLSLLSEFNV